MSLWWVFRCPATDKEKPQSIARLGFCFIQCLAMTYSHMGKPHTTIGDVSFHFRVRDGIGWFQHSMVTRQNWFEVRRFRRPSGIRFNLSCFLLLAAHSRHVYGLSPRMECMLNNVWNVVSKIALALYGQASRVISTG